MGRSQCRRKGVRTWPIRVRCRRRNPGRWRSCGAERRRDRPGARAKTGRKCGWARVYLLPLGEFLGMLPGASALYPELAQKVAVAAVLLIAYSELRLKGEWLGERGREALFGMAVGVIAVIEMTIPIAILPGVFIDSRAILMGLVGFFGGPIAALAALPIALAYRVWIGGQGLLGGATTLCVTTGIGLIFGQVLRL